MKVGRVKELRSTRLILRAALYVLYAIDFSGRVGLVEIFEFFA